MTSEPFCRMLSSATAFADRLETRLAERPRTRDELRAQIDNAASELVARALFHEPLTVDEINALALTLAQWSEAAASL